MKYYKIEYYREQIGGFYPDEEPVTVWRAALTRVGSQLIVKNLTNQELSALQGSDPFNYLVSAQTLSNLNILQAS